VVARRAKRNSLDQESNASCHKLVISNEMYVV
jgi:hypothetical protein